MNEQETLSEEVPMSALYSHPQAKAFLSKVYTWMAVSMCVTAGVSIYSTQSPEMITWVQAHLLLLCLVTIGIVAVMIFAMNILTAGALTLLLLAFSAAEGLLFGPILCAYTQESLGITFACTAGTFGVMALYGATTKRDLSPWGRALFMILFGLIICLCINLFWGNGSFDLIISFVGVITFSLLTAYDTQKLLRKGLTLNGEERSKSAVMGALDLYLDFINLFLYLLRFLGDRK